MTDQFKELREALAKATPGPWKFRRYTRVLESDVEYWSLSSLDNKPGLVISDYEDWGFKKIDADLISLARRDLPELLRALDDACDLLVNACQRDYGQAERFLERMGRVVP